MLKLFFLGNGTLCSRLCRLCGREDFPKERHDQKTKVNTWVRRNPAFYILLTWNRGTNKRMETLSITKKSVKYYSSLILSLKILLEINKNHISSEHVRSRKHKGFTPIKISEQQPSLVKPLPLEIASFCEICEILLLN